MLTVARFTRGVVDRRAERRAVAGWVIVFVAGVMVLGVKDAAWQWWHVLAVVAAFVAALRVSVHVDRLEESR